MGYPVNDLFSGVTVLLFTLHHRPHFAGRSFQPSGDLLVTHFAQRLHRVALLAGGGGPAIGVVENGGRGWMRTSWFSECSSSASVLMAAAVWA
jgi:hypothetical protein